MLAMPKPWARLAASRHSTTIQGLAPLKPKKMLSSLTIGDPDCSARRRRRNASETRRAAATRHLAESSDIEPHAAGE